jgi:ubiquinone biosynthesis protein
MDYVKFLKLPKYFRNVQRLGEIVRVLIKYGFSDLLERLHISPYLDMGLEVFGRSVFQNPSSEQTFEHRLRLVFQDLGPIFIKFAQQLSVRPDLLPQQIIQELSELQDNAQPFEASMARSLIEEELGKSIDEMCCSFEDIPIGSASVSQVHKATLKDGTEVAIKVARPDLDKQLVTDLEILTGLASLLEARIPESRRFKPSKLVEEFAHVIRSESNFKKEIQSIQRFRKSLKGNDLILVPKVFETFSTRKVLTLEYIRGKRLSSEACNCFSRERRTELVSAYCRNMLHSIFVMGFFHGDPHPGNVLITDQGNLAILDFGAMGRLESRRRLQVLKFLLAIFDKDLDSLTRVLRENQVLSRNIDEISFRNQIAEVLDEHLSVSFASINLSKLLGDIFSVVRKFEITPPADLLFVARALTSLHQIGLILDEKFHPIDQLRSYLLKQYTLAITNPLTHARDLRDFSEDIISLCRDLPVDIRNISSLLSREKFTLYHQYRDIDDLMLHHNKLGNRFIMLLIGCTFLIVGSFASNLQNSTELVLRVIGFVLIFLVWRSVKKSGGM